MGEGWVGVWSPHVLGDHGVHARGIYRDFVIPEAYDPIAFALQESAPVGFLLRKRIMLAAIDFGDARSCAPRIGCIFICNAARRAVTPTQPSPIEGEASSPRCIT